MVATGIKQVYDWNMIDTTQIEWEIELDEGQYRLAALWRGREVASRYVAFCAPGVLSADDIVSAATECVDEFEHDAEQEAAGKVPCDNCECSGQVRGMFAINVCHYCDGAGWVHPKCRHCNDEGVTYTGSYEHGPYAHEQACNYCQ